MTEIAPGFTPLPPERPDPVPDWRAELAVLHEGLERKARFADS